MTEVPEFKACADSWRSHHASYRYCLWDDRENEDFVRQEFGWYYKTWLSFDKNIKRLDSIRYMWMHKFGGIYADLDMECLQPLDGLISMEEEVDIILFCDFDAHGHCLSANPALIISKPGNCFWLEMLRYAAQNIENHVIQCTGPDALAKVAAKSKTRSRIALFDQNKLFIRKSDKSFYTEIAGNEEDAVVYRNTFCVTRKPPKYYEDRKRKYVADWHGTPVQFRWHNEYVSPPGLRRRFKNIAQSIRSRLDLFSG